VSDGGTLPLPPLKPAAAATLVKMAKLLEYARNGPAAHRRRTPGS